MLVEVGHFALTLALAFAMLQVVIPSAGIFYSNSAISNLSKPLLWGQFFWIVVSFVILMNAFVVDDFSVKYVANNSNTQLPTIYKIAGVWGAHEGSLLNVDLTTMLNILKIHGNSKNAVVISCGDVLSVCTLRQRETSTKRSSEELLTCELTIAIVILSGDRQRVAFGHDIQISATEARD